MMGTKQSFRNVGRQRITEKTICKVANGDGGANIKELEASRETELERESVVVNGCNSKGHVTEHRKIPPSFCSYCLKRRIAESTTTPALPGNLTRKGFITVVGVGCRSLVRPQY